jgi:hypothetical protein
MITIHESRGTVVQCRCGGRGMQDPGRRRPSPADMGSPGAVKSNARSNRSTSSGAAVRGGVALVSSSFPAAAWCLVVVGWCPFWPWSNTCQSVVKSKIWWCSKRANKTFRPTNYTCGRRREENCFFFTFSFLFFEKYMVQFFCKTIHLAS